MEFMKTSYQIERRASQYISMFGACFIWATLYPMFYIWLALFGIFFYHTERYRIGKGVSLKRSDDIYLDELLEPITTTLKSIFVFKIVLCTFVFVMIEGSNFANETSIINNIQAAF